MYLNINNQEIYYQKLGHGKNLILLHGWKQDVSTFHGVSEELKKHFTLWLIDLPGFGRSENPKKDFTVSDYADIVKEFIEKNKIKNPSLLGHSLGGRIEIKLASQNPGILDKLVLESSAGLRHEHDFLRLLSLPLAKLFNLLIPDIFSFKKILRHKFYKRIGSDYMDAQELKQTFINLIEEDLTPDLQKIATTTLIIGGSDDTSIPPRDQKRMYRLVKFSRLEILDNVGHFPHIEQPEKFLYFVKDFLT